MRYTALLLLVASLGCYAKDFQTIPLSEAFLPMHAKPSKENSLPFLFTVPNTFERRDAPQFQYILWGTKDDIEVALTSNSLAKSANGLFTIRVSSVGYDNRTKKFSGEDQLTDPKAMPGLSNVKFHKLEVREFPMATLTAETKDRRLLIHYIAIGTATLRINYYPAENFTERDSEIWATFIRDITK